MDDPMTDRRFCNASCYRTWRDRRAFHLVFPPTWPPLAQAFFDQFYDTRRSFARLFLLEVRALRCKDAAWKVVIPLEEFRALREVARIRFQPKE